MRSIARWLLGIVASAGLATADGYDPLKVPEAEVASKIFDVKDAGRDRTLPIRVYLPAGKAAAPVVIFSHGLGGSRDNNPYLGNHWAKRGYVVVFLQHPGSDETVWKDTPRAGRMGAMREAASANNLILRVKDVPAVLDELGKWNGEKDHPLHARLDLRHTGMSGHSFGAVTTQAVAGQSAAGGRMSFTDSRISAAVMFSPSPPKLGDPAAAFSSIRIPCLLMTGTLDTSPIGNTGAEDRLKVFPHLTQAPAWQVVFDKATHMSFGDRDLQGNPEDGNRYHQPILALTTAFWDAELRGNKDAEAWLVGEAAKSVMKPGDRWEMNARAKDRSNDPAQPPSASAGRGR
ncbi:MAG: dienelactone hydrolase [Verrucomicrobiaceae bacterium]|nr:MAG: dienelactone hydrolase [Verrucomicrobiaceae bacterium]